MKDHENCRIQLYSWLLSFINWSKNRKSDNDAVHIWATCSRICSLMIRAYKVQTVNLTANAIQAVKKYESWHVLRELSRFITYEYYYKVFSTGFFPVSVEMPGHTVRDLCDLWWCTFSQVARSGQIRCVVVVLCTRCINFTATIGPIA